MSTHRNGTATIPEPDILALPEPTGSYTVPVPDRVIGLMGAEIQLGQQPYHFARFTASGIRHLQAYLGGDDTQLLIAPIEGNVSIGEMVAEAAILDVPDNGLLARLLSTPSEEQQATLTTLGITSDDLKERLTALLEAISPLEPAERRTLCTSLFGAATVTAAPRLTAFWRKVLIEDVPDDLVDRCFPDEIAASVDSFFHVSGFRLYEATLKNSLGRSVAAMTEALAAATTNAPTTPEPGSTSSTKLSSP